MKGITVGVTETFLLTTFLMVSASQYPPERFFDIISLRLEIIPNFQTHTIEGDATYFIKLLSEEMNEICFDSVELQVTNLTVNGNKADFILQDDQIRIIIPQSISTKELTINIQYAAKPREGLYFRTSQMGYPPTDTHLFTQGEAISSRYWFPCYDAPDERLSSELICWVPEGMIAFSNGKLIDKGNDPIRGLSFFHWRQNKPHTTYLVTLVAGFFNGIETNWHGIPVSFYAPPTLASYIKNSFEGTIEMLAFFEEATGYPFPWDKYTQVCVRDFVAGGMENTSLTVLTHRTLFPEEMKDTRSSRSLVAHELAHQWFGDLVTCEDWAHIWLNEGFATYFENLYRKNWLGNEEFLYQKWLSANQIFSYTNDLRPIVWRGYKDPDEQFDYRTYPKAAWILHMIHSQIGETLWKEVIKEYLHRFAFHSVETDDFKRVLEDVTGLQWDRFFDQWLRQGGFPILKVHYSWDPTQQIAQLNIKQTQPLTNTLPYVFPLKIRFGSLNEVSNFTVRVRQPDQTFSFKLSFTPQWVRIDPELELLAKIDIELPYNMWESLLTLNADPISRIVAISKLAESYINEKTISLIREILQKDPVYFVRIEAAKTLGRLSHIEAWKALAATADDADPKVRLQVWKELSKCYLPELRILILERIEKETNPEIQAAMLKCLRYWKDEDVKKLLIDALWKDYPTDELAIAALDVIEQWEDPQLIEQIIPWLQNRKSKFIESHLESKTLRVIARLGKNLDQKEHLLDLLKGYLNDQRKNVLLAAIDSMGILQDPNAVPILKVYQSKKDDRILAEAARTAIEQITSKKEKMISPSDIETRFLSIEQRLQHLESKLKEKE